jgi:hypothetical protein
MARPQSPIGVAFRYGEAVPEPTIEWISPESSLTTVGDADDDVSVSFTVSGGEVVQSATFVNDGIYINSQDSNKDTCRVPAGAAVNKLVSCPGIRVAPGGIVNTIRVRAVTESGKVVTSTRQVVRFMTLRALTTSLPNAVIGKSYGHGGWPLRCTGGQQPHAFSAVTPLPPGFTVAPDGMLVGTAEAVGAFPFTYRCVDARGETVEQAVTLPVVNPSAESPHDWFNEMAAHPGAVKIASLRDAAQVVGYRNYPTKPTRIAYVYPTDADPRKQDGAKIWMEDGDMGPGQQLHIPFESTGKDILIALDFWYGNEWHHHHSRIQDIKGTPGHLVCGGEVLWVGHRINFRHATLNMSTLPPGGPFMGLTYPQVAGKGAVPKPPWHMGVGLPTNVAPELQRQYNEAIAPVDESIVPGGQELGIVAERWTRVYHLLQRVPSYDYISTYPTDAGMMKRVYRWTTWMSDTEREPMRWQDEALVGIPATKPQDLVKWRIEHAPGNSAADTLYVGRGPLTAYYRNFIAVQMSRAEALTQLRRPV